MKVVVNLPTELIDNVRKESHFNNTNMTTEIINGIRRGQFISREIDKGSKVLIENKNGKMFRLTNDC
jgi:hypothetical protein